jgi:hypothetical protein
MRLELLEARSAKLSQSPRAAAARTARITAKKQRHARQREILQGNAAKREAFLSRQITNFPDLYEFYRECRVNPPRGALDGLVRFLRLWPQGWVLSSNELFGNGTLLKFDSKLTKEAICQLEKEGALKPLGGKKWQWMGERLAIPAIPLGGANGSAASVDLMGGPMGPAATPLATAESIASSVAPGVQK